MVTGFVDIIGCAEGQSPFAGSLGVSLTYNFPPSWPEPAEGKGARGMVERDFSTLLGEG